MKTGCKLFGTLLLVVSAGCAPAEVPLKSYPVVSGKDLVAGSAATFDKSVSSDGNGSLKLQADQPMTFTLYETGDLDVEDNRVMYRAKLRCEGLQGQAYLEMWCVLGGQEAFSRTPNAPVTGDQDWTAVSAPFFLQAGENPDNLRLNVVVEGQGTVWIDEIEVTKLDK